MASDPDGSTATSDAPEPSRHTRSPAAEPPQGPVTKMTSPAWAPWRRTADPAPTDPRTVTETTRVPADETSPPTTGQPLRVAAWATPSITPKVNVPAPAEVGTQSATSAPTGCAPMAARSLR